MRKDDQGGKELPEHLDIVAVVRCVDMGTREPPLVAITEVLE